MEATGKLTRQVGRGTFVGYRAGNPPIRTERPEIRTFPAEVFETRLIVEPAIAVVAAQRVSSQELGELERLMHGGGTSIRDTFFTMLPGTCRIYVPLLLIALPAIFFMVPRIRALLHDPSDLRMASDAAHAAQQMAKICPVAMISVRSKDGRSHTREEFSSLPDIIAGIRVLAGTLYELAW